jgi:hypothetical protein
MSDIPGHISPPYSEEARDDALFHYTSAAGLIGILRSQEMWATAYYCTNDSSELAAGKDVLKHRFSGLTSKMIREDHPLVLEYYSRGVDPMQYADGFESLMTNLAFNQLQTYITCFCKAAGQEDYSHGLLSQWRGYGADGGYALQLSRKKLAEALAKIEKSAQGQYDLQDVFYTVDNPLREKVIGHVDLFIKAYTDHLEDFAQPLGELVGRKSMTSPIANLWGGPIESLVDYLIHTKNSHFSEERECRFSFMDIDVPQAAKLPSECFDRNGLIVPYKRIPATVVPFAECIEWIVIGPNQRMKARFDSVRELVKSSGLRIKVRPSHIPFVRT